MNKQGMIEQRLIKRALFFVQKKNQILILNTKIFRVRIDIIEKKE
jgi:hypothetical protein